MSGLHQDATATLRAWAAPDAHHESLRTLFLAHLAGHPDAMTRVCRPAHLTAGVLVVDHTAEHVLLNLHRKAQRWFHFGGHCEPDDSTLAAAALREGLEESGLDSIELSAEPLGLDRHTVEFCGTAGAVDHFDVRYTARVPREASISASEESLDVRWWPVKALPEGLEPEMLSLVDAAQRYWRARPLP